MKPPLVLLIARWDDPWRDFVILNLGAACLRANVLFDAYIGAPDGPIRAPGEHVHQALQGGALFSAQGSMLVGGRHHQTLAGAMARFRATVVLLRGASVGSTLASAAAEPVVNLDGGFTEIMKMALAVVGAKLSEARHLVAVQTEWPVGSPLRFGVVPYLWPEVVDGGGLAVPLEMEKGEIERLRQAGLDTASFVGGDGESHRQWADGGVSVQTQEAFETDDTYLSLTFRWAERWHHTVPDVDLCEPVLASHWLPYAMAKRRLMVCGETLRQAATRLASLLGPECEVVHGRYAGGAICSADDDEELLPLFDQSISFEVIEPRRPVLRVLAENPGRLPRPAQSPFDGQPTDVDLRRLAARRTIVTSLVLHSGEVSHDDAMFHYINLSALTGVPVGMGMHVQRYRFNSDCVEPLHTPRSEGGVLGLIEPVLHSTGWGICAEGRADPGRMARAMGRARDAIAEIAGREFAPRGVYCYWDVDPADYTRRRADLWKAIEDQGFEYVLSSVDPGPNQILHLTERFIVLNLNGNRFYPYSPFVRVNSSQQLVDFERQCTQRSSPAWMVGVIDAPIFGYSSYLELGVSHPAVGRPIVYRDAHLADFFNYVRSRGEMLGVKGVTPHTLARYARILVQEGYLHV